MGWVMTHYELQLNNGLFEIFADGELIGREGAFGISNVGFHNHWTDGMKGDYKTQDDLIDAHMALTASVYNWEV